MHCHRLLAAALCLLVSFLAAPAHADPARAADWSHAVGDISSGADGEARALAITRRLDQLGIAWKAEAFELDGQRGTNVIADLGGPIDRPLLLIGAHYDRVAVGHGATDNASGSAIVLALAEALKLRGLSRHRVQVAFWDLEEAGLLGARAWTLTPDRAPPALYVNFDVFGWGDTLWMMAPTSDDSLAAIMRKQSSTASLLFRAGEKYPPTDHLAFLRRGWPAVSFSLMGSDEIDSTLAVFEGTKPATMPKVMRVIHSADDTVEQIDSTHVSTALQVLEAGLREWDDPQEMR